MIVGKENRIRILNRIIPKRENSFKICFELCCKENSIKLFRVVAPLQRETITTCRVPSIFRRESLSVQCFPSNPVGILISHYNIKMATSRVFTSQFSYLLVLTLLLNRLSLTYLNKHVLHSSRLKLKDFQQNYFH